MKEGLQRPRVLLLNGPSRTGKDSSYEILYDAFGTRRTPIIPEKFSAPIKKGIPKMFQVHEECLEDHKEEQLPELYGLSYREMQISLSEMWFKKAFGANIFGRMCADRIMRVWKRAALVANDDVTCVTPTWIITDAGFKPECEAIVDIFGEHQVALLRLHRDGQTYKGDSRGYVRELGDIFTDDVTCNSIEALQIMVGTFFLRWNEHRD